jgi:hypothetical protein
MYKLQLAEQESAPVLVSAIPLLPPARTFTHKPFALPTSAVIISLLNLESSLNTMLSLWLESTALTTDLRTSELLAKSLRLLRSEKWSLSSRWGLDVMNSRVKDATSCNMLITAYLKCSGHSSCEAIS